MYSIKPFAIAISFTILSGCVWGQKIDYRGSGMVITPPITGKIGVSVLDRRPYVVSGEKSAQWVGLSRNVYQMPFGVHTTSGRPLADDLAGTIVACLKTNSTDAVPISVDPSATLTDYATSLRNIEALKGLQIELRQWRTDVGIFNSDFDYDVLARTISPSGEVLGQASQSGHNRLGRELTLETVMSQLFNRLLSARELALHSPVPSVIATDTRASSSPPNSSASRSPKDSRSKCTTNQILQMNGMGMTADQITAACP